MLFLAVFVGLNVSGPQVDGGSYVARFWGWPFPIYEGVNRKQRPEGGHPDAYYREYKWLPWTHKTYHIFFSDRFDWLRIELFEPRWEDANGSSAIPTFWVVMDALVAIIPLVLILCIQIPRREVPLWRVE